MLTVIVVAILGAVILGAVGWLFASADHGLRAEPPAHPDLGPTDRPLTADDVAALRFRLAFRGYRMSDVDAALDRLTDALREAESRSEERNAGDEAPAE